MLTHFCDADLEHHLDVFGPNAVKAPLPPRSLGVHTSFSRLAAIILRPPSADQRLWRPLAIVIMLRPGLLFRSLHLHAQATPIRSRVQWRSYQFQRPRQQYRRFDHTRGLLTRWAAKPTFYRDIGIICAGAGGFYVYNLEEVPVSLEPCLSCSVARTEPSDLGLWTPPFQYNISSTRSPNCARDHG
jgi:hypothetical protein